MLQFNAIGTDPQAQASLKQLSVRNVYLLLDAQTGEVLRSTDPPGSTTTFFLRQWNVQDLMGRQVVFKAVNNANSIAGLSWFGFYGLAQVANEYMTLTVSSAGNEYYGSDADWDAHLRYYGATLVYNM